MPSRSGGAAQGQPRPHVDEPADQRVDVGVAVQWRRGQAQALGAARHGRVVDRLDTSMWSPELVIATPAE